MRGSGTLMLLIRLFRALKEPRRIAVLCRAGTTCRTCCHRQKSIVVIRFLLCPCAHPAADRSTLKPRPRCRIGRLPEVETLAAHLRDQGFVVVAAGVVADGRTKIYASARGIGVEALFFAELVSSFSFLLFDAPSRHRALLLALFHICPPWTLSFKYDNTLTLKISANEHPHVDYTFVYCLFSYLSASLPPSPRSRSLPHFSPSRRCVQTKTSTRANLVLSHAGGGHTNQ